ncbi:MAG: NADH-quinone oxidoreductase subunit M [Anaerolineae bacterium]|nr:NADH-quinone oxidoreductase subunit M [Anaerolineae bacterium]
MERNDWLITIILFLPVLGLVPIMFMTRGREGRAKWYALAFSLATFILSLTLLFSFDTTQAGLQHEHYWPWFTAGQFTFAYYVGVDGLSILLVVLTAFIMPLAILFSLYHVKERVRLYYGFMLLLEFAMMGVFVAQDLFLFYIFWEVSLVPMYFIVGIWGAEERIYAAVKFFLYTMAGSILMLLAILWMGSHFGTFNVQEITLAVQQAAATGQSAFPVGPTELLLFLGFFIAFAIKVPIWPLHSWLPDAHVQAPTAGSVILAGVLLKLGTYGLVRFNLGFFPQASVTLAPIIGALAVIGIIYGAWVSYGQTDVKKLVAYSSISHLGFVVLGIFALNAAGISGGTLQMVNHGISTGGLFLMVGMLYERRHTKAIDAFGGVWKVLPIFSGLALVITLSSMGLPGLNGFVGEFTILLGAFGSPVLGFWFTLFATGGVILAAVYLLYMWNKVFMGEYRAPAPAAAHAHQDESSPEHTDAHDVAAAHSGRAPSANPYAPLTWNETLALVAVVIAALVIGLYPRPFFQYMDASAGAVAAEVQRYIPGDNAAVQVESAPGVAQQEASSNP